MKTLIVLLQVVAVSCILTSCEGSGEKYPAGTSDMLKTINVSIDVIFTTSFSKSITGKGRNTDLNGSVCRLEQFGSGTDGELGEFDVYLTCSWNPADGSHSCTEGFITDPDDNTLFFVCMDGDNGVVFTPFFPYDQTYICSEFEFTRGTGRFEGASGRGKMECDVKGDSDLIIHHWVAILTLVKE